MLIVIMILPSAAASPSPTKGSAWRDCGVFNRVRDYTDLVNCGTTCELEGCGLVMDKFAPELLRAWSRGYVTTAVKDYILEGFVNP